LLSEMPRRTTRLIVLASALINHVDVHHRGRDRIFLLRMLNRSPDG
jgi:hypothetical protein